MRMARPILPALGILVVLSLPSPAAPQAVGGEFQVNTTFYDNQWTPAAAMDRRGNLVVVWDGGSQDGDGRGIFAQLYEPEGTALGSEFQVNSFTTGDQRSPTVAMDQSGGNGGFVVAWASGGQDGDSYGIYAQRFAAGGSPIGSEFRVNSYTTGSQFDPEVAVRADGGFVVVWQSPGQNGAGLGIFGQLFNPDGTASGAEFQANTYTTDSQLDAAVAMSPVGDFMVAWTSNGQDGSALGVYAQRFDADGSPNGTEFRVNSHTTAHQFDPSVGVDASGGFVVSWSTAGQDGSGYGVFARRYDALGNPLGGEFQVNTYTTGAQYRNALAVDANGAFVVAWQSLDQDGDAGYGVFAQRYDSSGAVRGGEFRVNTYVTSQQALPTAAALGDGTFVVAWQSTPQDGSGYGVFAQRYDLVFADGFED